MVGKLNRSLYGTRDAAYNWQEEAAKELRIIGFKRGRYNPCLYEHASWKIECIIHGDDFVFKGEEKELERVQEELGKRLEIKTKTLGRGGGDEREARVLGRIIRVTGEGWEYEADPRHAEMIVAELQLQGANSVMTPGEEDRGEEGE